MARKPMTPEEEQNPNVPIQEPDPQQPETQPEQPSPEQPPSAPSFVAENRPAAVIQVEHHRQQLQREQVPEGVIRAPNPTPDLPKPGTRQPGERLALASIMTDDEPRVKMMIPANLILTLDDHTQVAIKAGPQDIPERLANHWYLAACGVKRI